MTRRSTKTAAGKPAAKRNATAKVAAPTRQKMQTSGKGILRDSADIRKRVRKAVMSYPVGRDITSPKLLEKCRKNGLDMRNVPQWGGIMRHLLSDTGMLEHTGRTAVSDTGRRVPVYSRRRNET